MTDTPTPPGGTPAVQAAPPAAVAMPPAVSPTGLALVPPKVVPFLTALFALAAGVAQLTPTYTIAGKVCAGLLHILPFAALLSPGLRKQG